MSLTPAYVLAASHGLIGAIALVAPLTTARLFKLAAVPSTVFVTRMLGVRDLVLGGGLLTLATAPKERKRGILIATNLINGIDIISALVSYAEGNMTGEALGLLLSSAAVLVGIGLWGVNSV